MNILSVNKIQCDHMSLDIYTYVMNMGNSVCQWIMTTRMKIEDLYSWKFEIQQNLY